MSDSKATVKNEVLGEPHHDIKRKKQRKNEVPIEIPSRLVLDVIDARYLFFEMVMGSIHSQMKRSYCKFKPVRAKVVVSDKFFLMAFGCFCTSFDDSGEVIPHHWQIKRFPTCCEGETIIGIITSVSFV